MKKTCLILWKFWQYRCTHYSNYAIVCKKSNGSEKYNGNSEKQPFTTLNLISFNSGRVFQLHRSQISHTKTVLVSKAFFSVRHWSMHSDKFLAWIQKQLPYNTRSPFYRLPVKAIVIKVCNCISQSHNNILLCKHPNEPNQK